MKNRFFIIIIILPLTFSCTQNVWISPIAVRPKKPKFSILKEPFASNSLINNSYLYISRTEFDSDNGSKSIRYFGFYGDGRMTVDNTHDNEMSSTLLSRNSWENAAAIGYYRTNDDRVKFQVFVSSDGGQYIVEKGRIRRDTIILERTTNFLGKKETTFDTLVRSLYPLK